MSLGSLDLQTLSAAYAAHTLRPQDTVRAIHERANARGNDGVWITRVPLDELLTRAAALEAQRAAGAELPLYGIPFALKDNIDVAGVPTTAACPAYAYEPADSATVVTRLLRAGAIFVGKTNLDQFATGLVGTRSPYGPCHNAFDPRYVSGGSSAGSAVAVATGLVSFALGTDTAGSGRVPAGFNNIVGLKPTRGLVSTHGVVPACRSLDCVSIFALTCGDAQKVLSVAADFDTRDPYSRPAPQTGPTWRGDSPFRFGVPPAEQLEFHGDAQAQTLYAQALARLEALGGIRVEIDFDPFRQTAALLYEGPWVAERLANLKDFVASHAETIHPVVRQILEQGSRYSAVDTFLAQQRLEELRRATATEWEKMDLLALPTTPTIYSIAEVAAEPIRRNADLGYYTNFVNLLDLCALAVPSGQRTDGLPCGATFVAPAFHDASLAVLGAHYHRAVAGTLGATPYPLPDTSSFTAVPRSNTVRVAVVGAHLTGQPLNHQLTDRGARLLRTCRTGSGYRLYALRGVTPPKPGLVFHPDEQTAGIEVEVWEMPLENFGSFVAAIPPPLGIGNLALEDGEQVKGFVCEPYAVAAAFDITHHGGWRTYLKSSAA